MNKLDAKPVMMSGDLNTFAAFSEVADLLRKKGFAATVQMKALPGGVLGYFISVGTTDAELAGTMAVVSLGAAYARNNEQEFQAMKDQECRHLQGSGNAGSIH